MHLGLQLQDQHSSSTESTDLPLQELNVMGKTRSLDQLHGEGKQMEDIIVFNVPELSGNSSQTETSHPMIQYHYAYPDPCLSGLYAAYGPHAMFQPHVMGAVPSAGRVPIPADLPDDGPVYVNAKQYHGILRRRQTRAKLEAQNKLVKNRRPYLHESRHQHALNRVRGTGGRFLSKKTSVSHPPMASQNVSGSFHLNHQGNMWHANEHHRYTSTHHGTTSSAEGLTVSSSDAGFQTTGISLQVGADGGDLVYGGNQRHYVSSIVSSWSKFANLSLNNGGAPGSGGGQG